MTSNFHTCNNPGDFERGESIFRQRNQLVVSVWRDQKLVYLMSTNAQADGGTTVRRKSRDGSTQQVSCPQSVALYNQFMSGVDKSDQLRHYYPVRCKTRKFYKYIFWFLFDSCTVNAFIVVKNFQPVTNASIRQITLKNFRVQLAQGLIGEYNSRRRYSLPTPVRALALNCGQPAAKRQRHEHITGRHFPVRLSKRSKCTYCWNMKQRRRDSYVWCRECGKPLCVMVLDPPEDGPSCFERYHTECL